MKHRNNQGTVLPFYGNSFDALLRLAVHEELTCPDPELEAILEEEADVQLPPQLEAYIQEFAKRKYQADQKMARKRRFARIKWSRVAIALIIVGLASFPVLYASVEAFRVGFDNIFFESREGNSRFNIHKSAMVFFDENQELSFLPEYLPGDLEISFSTKETNLMHIEFTGDNDWAYYDVQPISNTSVHEAGLGDDEFNFKINNCPAHISISPSGINLLTWYSDTHLFMLRSSLEEDEIIKMAESVFIGQS